jgi:hypothetical protein
MFKWQICYTEITNLLQFTINVRKSHRQPQCTLQLVCEDCVLFVWIDFHGSLCWQRHPKCERAIRLVYPPFFCALRSTSNPTIKSLTAFGLEIQTAVSRQPFRISHMFIFSHYNQYYHLPKYFAFLLNHPVYKPSIRLEFWHIPGSKSALAFRL